LVSWTSLHLFLFPLAAHGCSLISKRNVSLASIFYWCVGG
jgi:hypothetical protein